MYDALLDVDGDVLLATNEQGAIANELFQKTEGNDLRPAAAIGLATLIDAAKSGKVDRDALIMMNVTGGGEEMFKKDKKLFYLTPSLTFRIDPDFEEVKKGLGSLF
jgi:cysteate synthase